MPGLNLRERLIDPRSPEHRPHRAAYALPTLFTAGNIFLGFVSVMQSIQGAMVAHDGTAGAEHHFEIAAKTIGLAFLLDGLDGRIARLTNTTSDFGREMDSLADVISFGIAPAVLAYTWGVQFTDPGLGAWLHRHILAVGSFIAFMFLLCGSARLARFNVQKNPDPQESGPAQPQILRRVADPRGCRDGCLGGVRGGLGAGDVLALDRGVAGCCCRSFRF